MLLVLAIFTFVSVSVFVRVLALRRRAQHERESAHNQGSVCTTYPTALESSKKLAFILRCMKLCYIVS